MVVDVHGHLLAKASDLEWIAGAGVIDKVWLLALPEFAEPFYPDSPDLVFATDEQVLGAARSHPDFFLPFGYLDFREPPDAIDAQRRAGFVGLKAFCPEYRYDHPSYMDHYGRAQACGMPILFHMGGIGPHSQAQLGEGLSPRAENMRPCQLCTIAAAFPDLVVVGAHLGGLWQSEILEGIREYPNLYFDVSGGDVAPILRWLLDNLGHHLVADKVLTGIDSVYGARRYHQNILDRAGFWKLFFQYVVPWYAAPGAADRILRGNALAIHESMCLKNRVQPCPPAAPPTLQHAP